MVIFYPKHLASAKNILMYFSNKILLNSQILISKFKIVENSKENYENSQFPIKYLNK
jgi:hypothetical protein